MMHFSMDTEGLSTPCYVIDEGVLKKNIAILDSVQKRTGCKILLALKGFAMFSSFHIIKDTLKGTCASSLNEAMLGREEFGGEVHVFSPAYSRQDMEALIKISDHIIFNSFNQWHRHRSLVEAADRDIQCGLRINPEHSETEVELYDPCSKFSRLGIRKKEFAGKNLEGITGLHFHTLCEKNVDALERTLAAVENKFGEFIAGMEWVNFGGGHLITMDDYEVDKLCNLIINFKKKYGVDVYLEPGEAVALNSGVLVASVLDIILNNIDIAILDTSATAHMPDVLEMPYRPKIVGAGAKGEYPFTYQLGGSSCLAGDIIGDYSFKKQLKVGDKLIFLDMGHYTMVKTTTFNGINLPSIALRSDESGKIRIVRKFGYNDYKSRLS